MPAAIIPAGALAGMSTAGAIATTAVVGAVAGAAIGGAVAAFTGGDILKGALMGAAAGGIGGAISGLAAVSAPGAAAAGAEGFVPGVTDAAAAPAIVGGAEEFVPGVTDAAPVPTPTPTPPPVAAKPGILDRLLGEKGKYGLMEGLGKGAMKVGESMLKPTEEELSEIRIKEDAARRAGNRPGYVEPPSWTLKPEWQALLTGYKLPPPKTTGLLTQGVAA